MRWLDKVKSGARKIAERVFGAAFDERAPVRRTLDSEPAQRLDRGPATVAYLRRLFPDSVFTRRLTPSRRQILREIVRRLRPEQRRIVFARGWDKNICEDLRP